MNGSLTKYSVGSLFAGIGGICLGFKNAGFNVKWANEIDKYACETYRLNFPDHELHEEDIQKIKHPEQLGAVDVITSGFPCQAFSVAGYRQGFKDERGNLFFDTARFIESIKPRAYLLENVKNLRSHDQGRTLQIIRSVLVDDLGYSFIPFVLNSKDYGNIPQSRERIYIVGFRKEAQGGVYTSNFNIPSPIPLSRSIWDILTTDLAEDKYYYDARFNNYHLLESSITSSRTIYQWRRKYVRENKSNVCPTLTANMGTGGHNVPLVKDKRGIRKLTPLECVRFQGFPAKFKFPDGLADCHGYKQAGNSVVVPVIERIAREMLATLSMDPKAHTQKIHDRGQLRLVP